MFVLEVTSNRKRQIVIQPVKEEDYKKLPKKRYWFNWKDFKVFDVYKLQIVGDDDILGLMALEFHDGERRVEIKILAVAKEQVGEDKTIKKIAGCLFAYAARIAVQKYGPMAAVSLIPKTKLGQHYMDLYGFEQAGKSLYLDIKGLTKLLNEYDYD